MGEDFVLFGTDYPFPLGEVPKMGELIETSRLPTDVKVKLFEKNVLHFLGLARDRFL